MSDPISSADDLITLVQLFENGLIARVTDRANEISQDDYKRIRKILKEHPGTRDLLPPFIDRARTTDDIWSYISTTAEIPSGAGRWQARRSFIRDSLSPIVERLERENVDSVGEYVQVRLLGRGGFGQVFEYKHRATGESCAIKFFNPAFAEGGEPGFIERFLREARILRGLSHPNIIAVFDSGQSGRRPFIRMEHFPGKDLGAHLRSFGRFEPTVAARVIRALALGLEHAHEAGVIHRDLKPSNVMTASPGQLRVIDFGLGAFVERELVSRLTRTGHALVGGHYTAPELVSNPKLLDPRSDIYSLGAIWYELICGRPPAGSSISAAVTNTEMPSGQQAVLLKCLADVERRYSSVSELLSDLASVPK